MNVDESFFFDIRTPPDVEIPQDITEFVGTPPLLYRIPETPLPEEPIPAGIDADLDRRTSFLSREIDSKRELPRLLLLDLLVLPSMSCIILLATSIPLASLTEDVSNSNPSVNGISSYTDPCTKVVF